MRFSMRWQLSLSYGLIALVASLALGAVLISVLTNHYAEAEREYLRTNAQRVSEVLRWSGRLNVQRDRIQNQLEQLAFLPQTRIQLVDTDGITLADTGSPQDYGLSLMMEEVNLGGVIVGDLPGAPNMQNLDQITLNIVPEEALSTNQVENFVPLTQGINGFNFSDVRERRTFPNRSDQSVAVDLFNQVNERVGTIIVSEGPAVGDEIIVQVMRGWMIAGVVAVLLAALVGWMISWRITAPLKSVTRVTERMAAGDLSARAGIQRRDEIGTLATRFDLMAGRIESTVSTLRRFVADAAHEIHTPITAIRTNLELLMEKENGASTQTALRQLDQLQMLADDLLDLSRLEGGDDTEHQPLDLRALLWQISEIYASRAEQVDLDFALDIPEMLPQIYGNSNQLERMVSNLLHNAIKFTPPEGQITLQAEASMGQVRVSVQDTGIGIPAEDLPHLFERFRRGKNASTYPGSGLGLAIVKAIAVAHGGTVQATSDKNGTTFTVTLPHQSA